MQSRALTYYRERVAPTLACFAIEAQDFFNVTVPQASHSQPVIKHMVIAIASLQEAIESSPSEMAQCRVIFGRHYSNAVAELTQRDGPPPTEVVLISCLLFLACENFQGSTLAGLLHIQSGLKILQDWKTSQRQQCITNGSTDDLISTQIEPIFTRLETQMAVYTAPRAPESPYPSPGSVHLQKPPVLPSSFANLFGARDSLDDIMQWTFNGLSLEDQPFTSLTATIISRKLLHNWLQAMKVLTNSITSHGLVEARTASALLVHYRVISIWLDERTATIETTYDKYRDDFRTLLIQSERIIMHREYGVTSDWSEYNDRMSLFESDFGMIPPLFFIACHCRDSALRRKATRLMRYLHRAEGAWDSCSAAKIVDGIIDIEERGIAVVQSCRNISEHKRIRAVDADINPAYTSSVVLTFTRWPYTEPHQELIDWASWSRSELASLTVWVSLPSSEGLSSPSLGAYPVLIMRTASRDHHPERRIPRTHKARGWGLPV